MHLSAGEDGVSYETAVMAMILFVPSTANIHVSSLEDGLTHSKEIGRLFEATVHENKLDVSIELLGPAGDAHDCLYTTELSCCVHEAETPHGTKPVPQEKDVKADGRPPEAEGENQRALPRQAKSLGLLVRLCLQFSERKSCQSSSRLASCLRAKVPMSHGRPSLTLGGQHRGGGTRGIGPCAIHRAVKARCEMSLSRSVVP